MSADKKERYWGEERNAKRREAYQTDPARAAQVREQRRESYRRNKQVEPATLTSCIDNLSKLEQYGARLAVTLAKGSTFVIDRVYTKADLAELLNRKPQVVYRWLNSGILPPPALINDTGGSFYSQPEVRAFVTILGEHQKTTPHYRVDHTDIKDRLFAASFHHSPALGQAWLQSKKEAA